MKKLSTIILVQKDHFFTPSNVEKVLKSKHLDVLEVIEIKSKSSLSNKKLYFLKVLGFSEAMRYLRVRYQHFWSTIKGRTNSSTSAVCNKYGKKFKRIESINKYIQEKNENIDLILSFSCPTVLKKSTLHKPSHGCINVHSSFLPFYAGLMPSFWVIHENQKESGVTVHYMNEEIDGGQILNQKKFAIPKGSSVFEVLKISKRIAGELMLSTINQIYSSNLRPKENTRIHEHYRSWPSISDYKKFKRNGKRFF